MPSTGQQNPTERKELQAQYRAAWCSLLIAVRHWQSLQAERSPSRVSLREAEAAAHAAEEQYRQARNALADDLLEQNCRERDARLVGYR